MSAAAGTLFVSSDGWDPRSAGFGLDRQCPTVANHLITTRFHTRHRHQLPLTSSTLAKEDERARQLSTDLIDIQDSMPTILDLSSYIGFQGAGL
ncbi:hypothetical protein CHU98_g526 [Xylaria longipes]|nr:hypothetical protein CHU98_g526 [Xylaria longipes]